MRRLVRLAALLFFLIALGLSRSPAQVPMTGAGVGAPSGGAPPSCTPGAAATTFLARTSGLSPTETAAACNMINGMVADGVGCSSWSAGGHLDALYIFPTNTTTTANLNLCSTGNTLTQSGTITFAADQGYTPNGSNGNLTTGFIPSSAGGNYTQNSATIGGYVIGSNTTAGNTVILGAGRNDGAAFAYLAPLTAASTENVTLNDATFANISGPNNSNGNWLLTRNSSSTTLTMYHNEASSGTATATSTALPDLQILIFALSQSGGPVDFFNLKTGAAFWGGGMASTEATKTQNRINGYMTALGINVY